MIKSQQCWAYCPHHQTRQLWALDLQKQHMARPILDLVSTGQPEWGPWMRTKKKKSNNKCVKIETGLDRCF